MIVYVVTCDQYDHLLLGFAHQFNKYWWAGQQVVVLGYRKPPQLSQLPDNFRFQSLGVQPPNRIWTDPLISFFKSINDRRFILMMDDSWILSPIDTELMALAEGMIRDGIAKKCHLHNTSGVTLQNYDDNFTEYTQDSDYRTSLHCCIWERGYFLKYLEPNMTCWDYELSMDVARNDGERILVPKKDIVNYGDLYRNGKLTHKDGVGALSTEDKDELKEMFSEDFYNNL
jgi:hypothetical protein